MAESSRPLIPNKKAKRAKVAATTKITFKFEWKKSIFFSSQTNEMMLAGKRNY